MPAYLIFRIACISFFLGVGIFSFLPFSFPVFLYYIAALGLSVLTIFFWRWKRTGIVLLVMASVMFGVFRFGIAIEHAYAIMPPLLPQGIHFRGIVITEPYKYEKKQSVMVETIEPFVARLFLTAPLFPRLLSGDTVSFQCPSIRYNNLKAVCAPRAIELETETRRIDITKAFGYIKYSYVESIERWLPSPHAQLLASILIGARGGFPRDLSQTFSSVGLSHIVAISGYNITVLIAFLASFIRRLPLLPRLRLPVLAGGIVLFTIFTGASPATVRAALMGIALLIAAVSGRRALGFQLLLGAAFLMVLYDPVILLSDRGFQLSCAATFGLLSIAPTLTRLCSRVSAFGGLRDIAIQTIAASLATLPFIVGYFGQFSLVSFVTNLLVVPLIPILMAIGFFWSVGAYIVSLLPSALFPFVDQIIQTAALIPWALLDYIITISEIFSRIPFPTLTSDSPIRTASIIAIVYGAFFFLFIKVRRRSAG